LNLTEQQKLEIIGLKRGGYGSRYIATMYGVSKSTVNNIYNRAVDLVTTEPKSNKPKILLFDLESTPSIVAAFGRWKQNIAPNAVIKEGGYLLSAAWKFLGEEEVHSVVLTPENARLGDDIHIIAQLYDAVEQADVVVAHNCDRFDWPLFKTRLLAHGFSAPKKVRTVDTLKIAKQLRFNSNKLDSLGNYMGVGRKLETTGMSLWLRCMEGDEQSLQEMQDYNIQDVELLEQVYLQLRGFDNRAPNMGIHYDDDKHHCPCCGSTMLTPTGNTVSTNLSKFDEYVCDNCGSRSRTRQSKTTKEQRKLQLV
jgi:transposase-like protein